MKLFTLFLLLNISLFSQNNLLNQIDKFASSEELKNAQWSIAAKYIDSNEKIVAYNSGKSLSPASGLKLFTTAAALDLLGGDFKFQTELYINGTITNGVLNGDIIIKGGGDPTLGSNKVDGSMSLDELMKHWTNSIKAYGIKHINGSVLADDNLFDKLPVSGYWYWIDLGNYYAAQTSALTINDNSYFIYFKPNKTVGEIAAFLRTEPTLPGVKFINEMKTGKINSGDNGYVYRSPYDSTAYLRGTIPQGYNEFSIKGSLPDPPLFAAALLTSELQSSGILVKGEPKKSGKLLNYNDFVLLSRIYSPELRTIVRNINKISNNLYTSQILKMTGLKKYGTGSREAGIKAIFNFLAQNNIDTTGLALYDGNGLSRSNMITAEMMTDLLSAITKKKYFADFFNSLSIAGDLNDDGSFKYFGRGSVLEKNARIKSGYIKGVRSHSGYLKGKSGRLISFSIIANNFTCETKKINLIHKKIMTLLGENY